MATSFVLNLIPVQPRTLDGEHYDESVIVKGSFDKNIENPTELVLESDVSLFIDQEALAAYFINNGFSLSNVYKDKTLDPDDADDPNAKRYIQILFSNDGSE